MVRFNHFPYLLFLKLLKSYSPKGSANQGFVLPFMFGLGLIMTVVGLTMIARSSDDQKNAIAQKQSANVLALAETGNTRTLAKLQGSTYLRLNYDAENSPNTEWEDDSLHSLYQPPCETLPPLSAIIDPYGSYTIISYEFIDAT